MCPAPCNTQKKNASIQIQISKASTSGDLSFSKIKTIFINIGNNNILVTCLHSSKCHPIRITLCIPVQT